jgi:HTH-type transcriptional regulator/antitoxin HigA
VFDYLSDQVEPYENEHTVIPAASPAETLRFLMQQHALKQKDLAKKLARRFNVAADLFI